MSRECKGKISGNRFSFRTGERGRFRCKKYRDTSAGARKVSRWTKRECRLFLTKQKVVLFELARTIDLTSADVGGPVSRPICFRDVEKCRFFRVARWLLGSMSRRYINARLSESRTCHARELTRDTCARAEHDEWKGILARVH